MVTHHDSRWWSWLRPLIQLELKGSNENRMSTCFLWGEHMFRHEVSITGGDDDPSFRSTQAASSIESMKDVARKASTPLFNPILISPLKTAKNWENWKGYHHGFSHFLLVLRGLRGGNGQMTFSLNLKGMNDFFNSLLVSFMFHYYSYWVSLLIVMFVTYNWIKMTINRVIWSELMNSSDNHYSKSNENLTWLLLSWS